jgi:hypothetical protein
MTLPNPSRRALPQESPRPEYRLFFLSPDDRILGRLELRQAADDKRAIKEVCDLRYPGIHELWDRARLIRRFDLTLTPENARHGVQRRL